MKGFKKITINKGRHYSNAFPSFFLGIYFSRTIIFGDSCRYICSDIKNQGDINKLAGFTDGFSIYFDKEQGKYRWKHSARFGWNYNLKTGLIDIFAYSYADGVNSRAFMCSVEINRQYRFEIIPGRTKYYFYVAPETGLLKVSPIGEVQLERKRKHLGKIFGVKHNPYFGGNETAPRKMNFFFRK